jgi:hypothetical protein
VERKKLVVVGVLVLVLLLGAGVQTASAQTQGGSESTMTAQLAEVAFDYALLAFTNAVDSGKQHHIDHAYQVFVQAFYGFVAILGSGADGRTPFFSISGYDQSSSTYTSPGSSEYQADFEAGSDLLNRCGNRALRRFAITGDIAMYYCFLFAKQAVAEAEDAKDNHD